MASTSDNKLNIFIALMLLANVMIKVSCTSRILDDDDDDGDNTDDNAKVVRSPAPAPDGSECAMKMTPDCAEEVFKSIFWKGTNDPTPTCCQELVSMGRDCNDILFFVAIAEMNNGTKLIPRNNRVWNTCVAESKAITPPSA